MIFNQDPLMYRTVMILVLIPMEGETRSYVLTNDLKSDKCERYKLENKHPYGAR